MFLSDDFDIALLGLNMFEETKFYNEHKHDNLPTQVHSEYSTTYMLRTIIWFLKQQALKIIPRDSREFYINIIKNYYGEDISNATID